MAYSRTTWVAEETPLSADNFNNIEDGIEELQAEKEDKVEGKGLSTNDYTDAEKTKLAGIDEGADAIESYYETLGGFSKTIAAQGVSSQVRTNSRYEGKRLLNLYAKFLGADDAELNVMYTLDYFNSSTGQWSIKIFNPSSSSVTVKKINVTVIYT